MSDQKTTYPDHPYTDRIHYGCDGSDCCSTDYWPCRIETLDPTCRVGTDAARLIAKESGFTLHADSDAYWAERGWWLVVPDTEALDLDIQRTMNLDRIPTFTNQYGTITMDVD